MKLLTNLAIVGLVLFTIISCKKETVPGEANITFQFDHAVGALPIERNTPLTYTSAAGNPFSVSELRYIISSVVLIDQLDSERAYNNYTIIDAFGNNKLPSITVPNGTYKKMRLTLGVDPVQNLSSKSAGDLNPGNNMYFGGNDGYIFFLHEGKYLRKPDSTQQDLIFHYGKPGNEVTFEIPTGGLKINGVNKTAYMTFDLGSVYSAPDVDFDKGPTRYSAPEDADWTKSIKANLQNSFFFGGSYEDK